MNKTRFLYLVRDYERLRQRFNRDFSEQVEKLADMYVWDATRRGEGHPDTVAAWANGVIEREYNRQK